MDLSYFPSVGLSESTVSAPMAKRRDNLIHQLSLSAHLPGHSSAFSVYRIGGGPVVTKSVDD